MFERIENVCGSTLFGELTTFILRLVLFNGFLLLNADVFTFKINSTRNVYKSVDLPCKRIFGILLEDPDMPSHNSKS